MLTLTTLLLALPAPAPLGATFPTDLLQDKKPVKAAAQDKAPAQDAAPMELPSAKDSDDPALEAAAKFIADAKLDKKNPRWKTNMPMPPKFEFREEVEYYWHLGTNKGPITIRLMADVAPMHVSSTIYLTRAGFYDDLSFHRVITGFMAQGGCPVGRGVGSPGYKYDGEFDPSVKHDRPGLLSMANAGPSTDGSQFFLTFVPTPHLDGKHTIFGEVVEGMENVKKLEASGSRSGTTTEPLMIKKATISIGRAKGMDKEKAMEEDAGK